jgi:pimeloyl-ACP methyl ester carboxylesterase
MTSTATKPEIDSGYLTDDIPYVKIGQGPPLVSILGLTNEHTVPAGMERTMALQHAKPLAADFTVYVVNRKKGLTPGESMTEIVGHLAVAIEQDIGEPVFLDGTSTGGSMALQLAVDHPGLVRRLVVIASAYKLGPKGKALQSRMAQLTREGRPRDAWALLMEYVVVPAPLRPVAFPLARLAVGGMVPEDPSDFLATVDAEDAFDVQHQLASITSPTLVIGGDRDVFYPVKMFRDTAAGVQDGRAHIFPGWGHGRTSASSETANIELGFMLAGMR